MNGFGDKYKEWILSNLFSFNLGNMEEHYFSLLHSLGILI